MNYNRYTDAWRKMQEAMVAHCKAGMSEYAKTYKEFREAEEEFETIKKEQSC